MDLINGSVVDSGTLLSCTADADAHPPAQYRWRNDVDGSESTGPQLVLQPGTAYKLTCNASNNFNRTGCYATDYVEFNSTRAYIVFVDICYYFPTRSPRNRSIHRRQSMKPLVEVKSTNHRRTLDLPPIALRVAAAAAAAAAKAADSST